MSLPTPFRHPTNTVPTPPFQHGANTLPTPCRHPCFQLPPYPPLCRKQGVSSFASAPEHTPLRTSPDESTHLALASFRASASQHGGSFLEARVAIAVADGTKRGWMGCKTLALSVR